MVFASKSTSRSSALWVTTSWSLLHWEECSLTITAVVEKLWDAQATVHPLLFWLLTLRF